MRMNEKNNGNIKYTKKISLLIFIMVCCLIFCLILGGVHPFFNNIAEALTAANVNNAYKPGDGADLWDSTGNAFNSVVLNDLISNLFGTEDPVDYIKANGADDYQTYGTVLEQQIGKEANPYYVVPASKINARLNGGAGNNNGIVVNLNGIEWMVTSLTLADIGSSKDNVVLTLYQTQSYSSSRFFNTTVDNAQSGMYSCSELRNNLLKWDYYKFFSNGTESSFANQFLVQPTYIKYQETQSAFGRKCSFWGRNKTTGNDAYGNITVGWGSNFIKYKPGDTYNDPDGNPQSYEAWQYDYIWVPSATETGAVDAAPETSIWQLSTNQIVPGNVVRLRSGSWDYYFNPYTLLANGNAYWLQSAQSAGVRPAIHLNLTAAGLGTLLQNPSNITTTYNGDVQTVKSAVSANATAYPWYNSKWYEHSGNYVSLTYQDLQGAEVTNIKNAGEYWVKAEITQAWINAVNAEVDRKSVV